MKTTRTGYETTKGNLEAENTQYDKDIKANNKTVSDNTTSINAKKAQITANELIIDGLDKKMTTIANLTFAIRS